MNRHGFFTKDGLRGAPPRAMLIVGGGWNTPHPGWGWMAASRASARARARESGGRVAGRA
jgi:hypothetical protein